MLPTLSSQALTKILPPCVTCTNRMRPSSVQKQNHVLFFGQRMKRYGLTHTLPARTGCGLCCFLRVPLLGKEGTVLARRTGWTQRLQTAAILNHSILWEASAHSPQAEVPSGAVWCQELWSEGLCARPLHAASCEQVKRYFTLSPGFCLSFPGGLSGLLLWQEVSKFNHYWLPPGRKYPPPYSSVLYLGVIII